MPDGGVSFNLDDLKDALPKFQLAVKDIQTIISTVNGTLNELGDVMPPGHLKKQSGEACEHQLQAITDALDRAIVDYEEVLAAPVGEGPGGGGIKTGPHKDGGKDDSKGTNWPDGKPGKPPKDNKNDKDDNGGGPPGGHPHGSPPGQSQQTGEDDGTPPGHQDHQPGSQGQGNQQSGGHGSNQPGGQGEAAAAGAGAVPVVALTGAGKKDKKDGEEDDEETPEEEGGFRRPAYVSAVNKPLVDELEEKWNLLEETKTKLVQLEETRAEKAKILERLQIAAMGSDDPALEERIEQLKQEITDIDTDLYYSQQMLPGLEEEIDALQKRVDLISLGPNADIEAIRRLEGGETSQWIRDATRNEDNSVNCVNYIVNRMAIPGELPLNAHLWDEQAAKFADKYGITIGDVPLEGSVIVMEREHSYAHDIYGHVMYVEKVEDGIVWVTDNTYPDRLVRLDHLTTETSGPYIKYLYFPWQTKV
ncbi:MAG TPA: CHAP domain-containing protein [Spirillospora sp.]|nr:CHAP domain-containing protein [Spirillospora sp.]